MQYYNTTGTITIPSNKTMFIVVRSSNNWIFNLRGNKNSSSMDYYMSAGYYILFNTNTSYSNDYAILCDENQNEVCKLYDTNTSDYTNGTLELKGNYFNVIFN